MREKCQHFFEKIASKAYLFRKENQAVQKRPSSNASGQSAQGFYADVFLFPESSARLLCTL